jgi:hypothetical protein
VIRILFANLRKEEERKKVKKRAASRLSECSFSLYFAFFVIMYLKNEERRLLLRFFFSLCSYSLDSSLDYSFSGSNSI